MDDLTPEERTARWLHHQLRRRDWLAADLARALEVRQGTVSRWMRGEQRPSSAYAERIADVLHVDTDLVLTLAGHRPDVEEIDPDDPRAALIAKLQRVSLTADQVEIIDGMLDRIIRNQERQAAAREDG